MINIHFIAIGGSVMHDLAICMKNKGHNVTGSDDKFYDPSKSKLKVHDLLPHKEGWDVSNITKDLDLIVLGMHAKEDNPELIEARRLNIEIVSYPELVFNNSTKKKRVVIAGSHGKTTITSMVSHVLKKKNVDFDYILGAKVPSLQNNVKISDAKIILIEGDEYLSSRVDLRPKFLHYKPHISVLSGISWDHINVFPTNEIYVNQFKLFINSIIDTLIYNKEDDVVCDLVKSINNVEKIPYKTHSYSIQDNNIFVCDNKYKMSIIGKHNFQNLNAAKNVCKLLGVKAKDFYFSISDFTGAENRLEKVFNSEKIIFYRDFAHSPSKLKATIDAVKETHDNKIISIYELHTFSSFNKDFLKEYKDTFKNSDISVLYYDKNRNLDSGGLLESNYIKECFNLFDLIIINDKNDLLKFIKSISEDKFVILMMSSGNFNGLSNDKIVSLLE